MPYQKEVGYTSKFILLSILKYSSSIFLRILYASIQISVYTSGILVSVLFQYSLALKWPILLYIKVYCDEWGGAESRGNGARPVE